MKEAIRAAFTGSSVGFFLDGGSIGQIQSIHINIYCRRDDKIHFIESFFLSAMLALYGE